MGPEFYSLQLLLTEYWSRAASALREPDLRRVIDVQLALADEDNQ